MDKIFEPGAIADFRGDSNHVIEVQEKVKELLEANRQRREGLKGELREQGAWALPGLINATYVWMDKLENSADQKMLASLMAELAKDNSAAAELLFRDGILETPFPVSRSIAKYALEELEWKPETGDLGKLRGKVQDYLEIEDTRAVLDLYAMLLSAGKEKDFHKGLEQCKTWARRSLESSGKLLAILVDRFPGKVVETLTAVILATRDAYRDKNVAETLVEPIRPIPYFWLRDGILIQVSDVLRRLKPPRHTMVEYLWKYAIKDCQKESPGLWQDLFASLHDKIQQERMETLYRYWFEALGESGEIDYLIKQANLDDESWGGRATLQLFFQKRRDKSSNQALKDLKVERPERYERAQNLFEIIHPIYKDETDIEKEKELGQLRTAA